MSLTSIIVGLVLLYVPAQAASITADGGSCTLSDAITAANSDTATGGCIRIGSGSDTITITNTVVITAPSYQDNALPMMTTPTTIEGNGHTIARDTTAVEPFRGFLIDGTGNLTLSDG